MTEAAYARKLRAAIKEEFGAGVVVVKAHGGPRQEAGISDLLLCVGGIFVAIELKQHRGKPTPLQAEFLRRVAIAGGRTWVLYTTTPVSEVLSWLRQILQTPPS